MTLIEATYEDRRTGRTLPVLLDFQHPFLVILRDRDRELDRWNWRDVAPVPGPFADDRLRLGLSADAHAVLAVADADRLLTLAHGAGMVQPVHREHRQRRELPLYAWIGGAILSLFIMLRFVLPALASVLAPHVPDWVQTRIGDQVQVLATSVLTRKGGNQHCAAPTGREALLKLAGRLPDSQGLRLHIIDSDLPNAFALPGGHVSVTTALMDKADGPDAVLGVIGHELGHLRHGHSMERVMRYGLSSTLVSMIVGDVGGGLLAVAVAQIVESEFSQDQERQADQFALDALRQARVSPAGLSKLFAAIRDEHPEADGVLAEWMGSHPTLTERITTLDRAAAGTRTQGETLTSEEWTALRAICKQPVPVLPASAEKPD
ncbi:MAG: M48 family metallopeptidase [Niveispirillum sp.]|nr:M48 family metallopeptidase [Niveispirillum sp.]